MNYLKKFDRFSYNESAEVKEYRYFLDNRSIKEEFISKLVRNISGKNKERIEEIKSLCKEIQELYFDTVTTQNFGDIDSPLKDKQFVKIYDTIIDKSSLTPDLVGGKEGINFIKNLIPILKGGKEEISLVTIRSLDTELDFIKSLDDKPYLEFKKSLEKVIKELKKEKGTVVIYAFIENLEKIAEQKSKALNESQRILSLLKSKETFYYYSQIDLKFDDGTWYKDPVARFVKSLVLKLDKNKEGEETKVCDRNLYVYAYYSINCTISWSYDDEYGIDYFDKKIGKETLDKKVGELENFKKLMSEIEEIKPILKEFYDKLDWLRESIGRLKSKGPEFIQSALDKYLRFSETFTQSYESKLKNSLKSLENELKSVYGNSTIPGIMNVDFLRTGYDKIFDFKQGKEYIFLNPQGLINLIEEFKKSYESKTIKEVLSEGSEKFSTVDLLEVTDSDSPNTWWKDEKKVCGNILYHGSIHYRLDQPGEIEKLIYKRSPYKQRYAGKGVYCTVYPSAACQYQHLRGTTGGISNQLPDSIRDQFLIPNSDYFPCIYKFTLKPGSKFEFKSDTTMEDDEFYNLQKIGLQGIHSGWNEVSGGETQETCIIDPECILKVEKLKPSEILNIDDDLWNRGSDFEKDTFIKWYRDLISQRKDN
jgi:hypothetical protein